MRGRFSLLFVESTSRRDQMDKVFIMNNAQSQPGTEHTKCTGDWGLRCYPFNEQTEVATMSILPWSVDAGCDQLGKGLRGEGPFTNPDTTLHVDLCLLRLARISRRHHSRAEAGKAERDISAVQQRPTAYPTSTLFFSLTCLLFSPTSPSPGTTGLDTAHSRRP